MAIGTTVVATFVAGWLCFRGKGFRVNYLSLPRCLPPALCAVYKSSPGGPLPAFCRFLASRDALCPCATPCTDPFGSPVSVFCLLWCCDEWGSVVIMQGPNSGALHTPPLNTIRLYFSHGGERNFSLFFKQSSFSCLLCSFQCSPGWFEKWLIASNSLTRG